MQFRFFHSLLCGIAFVLGCSFLFCGKSKRFRLGCLHCRKRLRLLCRFLRRKIPLRQLCGNVAGICACLIRRRGIRRDTPQSGSFNGSIYDLFFRGNFFPCHIMFLLSVIFFPAHWSQKSDEYRPSVGRRKSDAGADRFLQRNRSRKSR